MNEKSAVVLLSGGLDSAVTAAYLKANGYTIKAGVFVNRGQSNYKQELSAVLKVSEYLQVSLCSADFSLPDLSKFLSKEMRKKIGIPARNLILSTLTLPYIYVLDCSVLALGNIISDWRPDCNKEFRSKLAAVASQALEKEIDVVAPLADWEGWDKSDEIIYANNNGYADLFGLTWTCWLGGKVHCGACDACKGRKEGFVVAGLADPTAYGESQQ